MVLPSIHDVGLLQKIWAPIKKVFLYCLFVICTIMLWVPNLMNYKLLENLKVYEWSFCSLPSYFGALSLFLLFAAGKNERASKSGALIRRLASATFGEYLIHDNKHFRVLFWHVISKILPSSGFTSATLWIIPTIILAIYVLCTFIELVRQVIFKAIRFNTFLHLKKYMETGGE